MVLVTDDNVFAKIGDGEGILPHLLHSLPETVRGAFLLPWRADLRETRIFIIGVTQWSQSATWNFTLDLLIVSKDELKGAQEVGYHVPGCVTRGMGGSQVVVLPRPWLCYQGKGPYCYLFD